MTSSDSAASTMPTRALATPHPRLHALLDIIGDAEIRTAADNVRFVLPGTEQDGGVSLDRITVPDD